MVFWLRMLTAVWEAGTVPVQRQWHAMLVRSPAEMFALGRQQSTANVISVIGDDVLFISHGVAHLLTPGNVFMLAKAPMGQGKKETELMLCCGCQQSQTAPWQEAECENRLCFQTSSRSRSLDLQSCQSPAVLLLSAGWGSSHSGNLSEGFKVKPLAGNSTLRLNIGAQRTI